MTVTQLRKRLLQGKTIKVSEFEAAKFSELCDDSLLVFFNHCMTLRLNHLAVEAGMLLDKRALPRRGNVVDNQADSFLSLRAARISRS